MTFTTIVGAQELAAHLHDAGWVVIDCRHSLADFSLGQSQYDAAHIPGAFFADVEHDLAGERTGKNGRHPLPDAKRFAAFLRSLGATPQTQIVAYDAGSDMFAARLWFLVKYLGHEAVAVLDGGFAAWLAGALPVTKDVPLPPENGTLQPNVQHHRTVDVDALLASLPHRELTVLDARAADRFAGQNETIDPVAGHIPGALHRHFKANYDDRGFFKPPDRLREEFSEMNVDPDRLVHQCGSGVSSAVNLLAMELAGIGGSRLYPGSWSEWVADRSRPVETGAPSSS